MNPTHSSDAPDELIRAICYRGQIRAVALRSTQLTRALVSAQDAGPLGAVALSRVTSAALLMAANYKAHHQLALLIKGDGPLKELYAVADGEGRVRATLVNPHAAPPEGAPPLDLGPGLGNGTLTVTRTVENSAPYNGTVPMTHGDLAQDLVQYFTTSEQIPTALGMGEWISAEGVEAAGGFLLQAMPGVSDDVLAELEARVESLPRLGRLFLEGETLEGLLLRLAPDPMVVARLTPTFYCPCSRVQFSNGLRSLGAAELDSLIADLGQATTQCHFCGKTYLFSAEELTALRDRCLEAK